MTAPRSAAEYEYVCTYPGHWEMMWGKLIVTKDVDAYLQSHPDTGAAKTSAQGAPAHAHHEQ